MSDKAAPPAAAPAAHAPAAHAPAAAAKPRKKSKLVRFVIVPLTLIAAPFLMPTLLLLVGMLPTLVALVTDDDEHQSRAVTIGSMNFVGVAPFLIDLWIKGQTMEVALQIARDPQTWLIMLGAAGIGQLLLFTLTPLAASFTLFQEQARLAKLKEGITELKAVWGEDIATTASPEAIRNKNAGTV